MDGVLASTSSSEINTPVSCTEELPSAGEKPAQCREGEAQLHFQRQRAKGEAAWPTVWKFPFPLAHRGRGHLWWGVWPSNLADLEVGLKTLFYEPILSAVYLLTTSFWVFPVAGSHPDPQGCHAAGRCSKKSLQALISFIISYEKLLASHVSTTQTQKQSLINTMQASHPSFNPPSVQKPPLPLICCVFSLQFTFSLTTPTFVPTQRLEHCAVPLCLFRRFI